MASFAYEIAIPGQGKFRVESPSELSDEQAYHAASRQAEALKFADPTSGMSTGDKFAAGAGKVVADLGRGSRQILSNVPGLNRFDTFNPQKVQADIDESRKLDAPLMSTTAGKVGNFAGNVAAAVPTMFIPGANTYTGAGIIGGAMGLLQPTVEGESRTLNTGLGAAGGVGGQYVGNKVGGYVADRLANRTKDLATKQAQNVVRDATLADARQAGYVFPPTSVNPSPVNSVLEGVGGKIKTAQSASFKNQTVTDELSKRAVGLAPDQPLTVDVLEGIRQAAGQNYKVVSSLQAVPNDQPFASAATALVPQGSGAVKNPAAAEIQEMVDGLLQKTAWTGDELVTDIKLLREMGRANMTAASRAGGDTVKSTLGKAQVKASALLEDLAERNLVANKAPADAVQKLKDARKLIAKTYTVEKALNEGSGHVSAAKLAAELNKGKPLSGELELVARTGAAFPKATQPADAIGSMNPLSAVDAMYGSLAGGATAAATGNPLGFLAAAAPLARPITRSAVLSGPYQRTMVNPQSYQPGLFYTGPSGLLNNPMVRRAMGPAGAAGLLGYTGQ